MVGKVADRLEELHKLKAKEMDIGIDHFATQADSLDLFVNAPASLLVSQKVFRLKGCSADVLRKESAKLKKMPGMWTTSYFAFTAGN